MDTKFIARRTSLIEEIETAFHGVKRGDGISLHQAIAIDDRATLKEQLKARELDQESRWQDVSEQDIKECSSALSFLDAPGFKYYLPAFMRHALLNFSDVSDDIRSSCEFHLTNEPGKSMRSSEPANVSERLRLLPVQATAIAHFLRFSADFDDIVATKAFILAVEKWERFVEEN